MGLDNPDLINRTVVRGRVYNERVTNAFKNKMNDAMSKRLSLSAWRHLHFGTVSLVGEKNPENADPKLWRIY